MTQEDIALGTLPEEMRKELTEASWEQPYRLSYRGQPVVVCGWAFDVALVNQADSLWDGDGSGYDQFQTSWTRAALVLRGDGIFTDDDLLPVLHPNRYTEQSADYYIDSLPEWPFEYWDKNVSKSLTHARVVLVFHF